MKPKPTQTNLRQEAEKRYINYALSVITSRALPDIRDGLKPVQRRILYAMYNDLKLFPSGRHRKSAAVVGRVIASYHPHGDQAVYDTMVRMAQEFTLRYPLLDGYGNFGSLDGDSAAAMRYTEIKLREISIELLKEIVEDTVDFTYNYDGTNQEPLVLPARFPHILINGITGIAVGIATNIPPHNLKEVLNATIKLIDEPQTSVDELLKVIQGPDFPVGGMVLTSPNELKEIYTTGQGGIKIRGSYHFEEGKRTTSYIVIDSVPYMINKSNLVEQIAELIIQKKIPQISDIRDESTDKVRVVLEIKGNFEIEKIMAYLYKHTDLEINYHYNLSCLVPDEAKPTVCSPKRLGLKEILVEFLKFRLLSVRRRLTYELNEIKKRIHLLEGFMKLFSNIDEAIAIIRSSKTSMEAGYKLSERFILDEIQVQAILDMRLARLSQLEVEKVLDELKAKQNWEKQLEDILKEDKNLWNIIKDELKELAKKYGDARKSSIVFNMEEVKLSPEEFTIAEDTNVIVTKDGWIKRIQNLKNIESTRIREGDSILAVVYGKTSENILFFSNLGIAYNMKISDIPATTGFGEPIRNYFKLADGEKIIYSLSLDPRITPPDWKVADDEIPPPYCVSITEHGFVVRFPLQGHRNVTTKLGRRFCRLSANDKVNNVYLTSGKENLILISRRSNVLSFSVENVPVVIRAGKGVKGMILKKNDIIAGSFLETNINGEIILNLTSGKKWNLNLKDISSGNRGHRGKNLFKKDEVLSVETQAIVQQIPKQPDSSVASEISIDDKQDSQDSQDKQEYNIITQNRLKIEDITDNGKDNNGKDNGNDGDQQMSLFNLTDKDYN